ncbi:hypothetical protein ACFFQW_11775 [Umezawaea endophytica]|uniref:Uncharacterized protein n=1 Tax=Umezawaea endophytica TaxID=1654476 RepID=A0A9X2VT75_9PSEU|nr:hypothetical protein [Umezawaea endophytica]MCS7482481.1 hypothetical protein [Umezawaea endophytica]
MEKLLKRFVTVTVAVGLGVAGLLLTALPASAARVVTTMEASASIVSSGTVVGTAQRNTAVRSYCLVGSNALIYSAGANRFGFVPRSALVNETQGANCFSGGTAGQVQNDADMRSCAGSSCGTVVGDAAPFDNLRMYCQMFDASSVRWMAIFNTNGSQTGFVRSSAFTSIPPTLSTC